ncbi:MAG: hypothetical protein LBT10_00235 [Methanobrevibacter sp.]|jgi:hypothetical protein|nr:hypothetical protein [Methanobrevibacter sp.]
MIKKKIMILICLVLIVSIAINTVSAGMSNDRSDYKGYLKIGKTSSFNFNYRVTFKDINKNNISSEEHKNCYNLQSKNLVDKQKYEWAEYYDVEVWPWCLGSSFNHYAEYDIPISTDAKLHSHGALGGNAYIDYTYWYADGRIITGNHFY